MLYGDTPTLYGSLKHDLTNTLSIGAVRVEPIIALIHNTHVHITNWFLGYHVKETEQCQIDALDIVVFDG